MMGSGPPSSTDSVYDLLSVLADPKAAKKRLDDLVAEKEAAISHHAKATEAHENAKAIIADADKLKSELDQREKAIKALHEQKTSQLAKMEADLNDRSANVDAIEKSVKQREEAANKLARDLKDMEHNLAQKQIDADAREHELHKSKAELDQKHAAIRSVLG